MRTPKRRVINRSFIFLFEFISLSGTVLWLKGVLSSSVPSAKPPNQPPPRPAPPASSFPTRKNFPKSSPQSFANQWIFKMAASMVKVVHQVNFCRFLRPAVRLGQLYSTESSPSVVGKQDKALEVVEDEAKVKGVYVLFVIIAQIQDEQYCCSLLVKFT